ncbi:dihydrolipoamide acetyltransferase family protein, partial [Micrococcus luteus]
PQPEAAEPERADAAPEAAPGERPRCTPPVRLYARRSGVDLEQVTGTGAGGVITRADVEAFLAGGGQPAAAATPPQSGAESAATGGVRTLGGRPRTEAVPVKGVRKATAAAMVQSAFTAPHVTEFLQVDVTETMELLAELKASREFRDVKLTPMTLAAKACLVAMERTPDVNARWDEAAGTIVRQNFVNLGFAAATPRGLMVPNVKDAQAMSLRELADAIRDLTGLARDGRLSPADLAGGTFTLTNVGVFGVDAGTPIINPGEGAIIAIGQVRRMPWEHRGEIALRDVMTLSLSFDHRFVDGEQGSRFLADVGAILRRPGLTLTMV